MKTLLQINTSLFSAEGQSSRLAARFAASWRTAHPDGRVLVRDLAQAPVPHLTAERFRAFGTPAGERSEDQQAAVDYSDALIEEMKAADVIVLALPMYNFGVPSTLKAYFDHIARAGVSFRYAENGPQGLLTGKRVYVFATRGGLYAGTPMDTETEYLRVFLRFLGMDDVHFIYAEGLAMNAMRERSFADAMETAQTLAAPIARAA